MFSSLENSTSFKVEYAWPIVPEMEEVVVRLVALISEGQKGDNNKINSNEMRLKKKKEDSIIK